MQYNVCYTPIHPKSRICQGRARGWYRDVTCGEVGSRSNLVGCCVSLFCSLFLTHYTPAHRMSLSRHTPTVARSLVVRVRLWHSFFFLTWTEYLLRAALLASLPGTHIHLFIPLKHEIRYSLFICSKQTTLSCHIYPCGIGTARCGDRSKANVAIPSPHCVLRRRYTNGGIHARAICYYGSFIWRPLRSSTCPISAMA